MVWAAHSIVGDIAKIKADAILLNFFEATEHLDSVLADMDKALAGAISQLVSQGEVKGKLNEITVIHSLGKLPASRVVIVGLGKKEELSQDKVRGAVCS